MFRRAGPTWGANRGVERPSHDEQRQAVALYSSGALKLLDTPYPQFAALPEPEMRPAWYHATR